MTEWLKKIIKERHEQTVFKALGITVDKIDPCCSQVSIKVDERHLQHLGQVHGGVYVTLAESAASISAACNLINEKQRVVALEINANHLRSTTKGSLKACAKNLHKGKRTLVYEVKVVNDFGETVSIARCTLLII